MAKKKKFERVVGFFWFCARQGWIRDNPTASMGRIVAKHVPTDYFTRDEYARILGATYRLDDGLEQSWAPEHAASASGLSQNSCAGAGCASAMQRLSSARG
ncbi:MAG TPA: hypothetical protein VFB43_04340 [Terracidiphilus sp.]|nr:hypothetical protein [Terracidiphilus sp.]